MCKNRRSAFTLIEVLIVVIIMAVLAATIIPQFSSSTKDAKLSSLKFNLHTIRSQLEMYKEQHLGNYPTAANFVAQLTGKTDQDGTPNAATGLFGPYIETQLPMNGFNNSNTVTMVTGTAPPTAPANNTDGWQYNAANGWFYPNSTDYFANPN